MKIIYHHRTLGDGAEGIHIQAIVNCLKKMGHEVKVVSLIGRETSFRSTQESKETPWDRIKSYIPSPVYELAEIAYNLKGLKMIDKEIREFKPDIIYDRYAHYSFAGLWAAKKNGLPLILEVNSPYSVQKRLYEKLYFPGLSKYGERKIFNNVQHIITVSTPLKHIVLDYGVSPEKITVLPNGTDPERFSPSIDTTSLKKKLGLHGKLILGFVGILRSWHNIDKLINVLNEIDLNKLNAIMLFLGDGPSFDELFKHNQEQGNEKTIRFLGRIPHSEINTYISMFDIAISPHATHYSSPMKILEYMALKKAVLAPDMENIRDLITSGETGLLFKPDNEDSLKEKLLYLINNPQVRKKMGENARNVVLASRTWSMNAKKTIELAEKLINIYKT